MRQDEFGQFGQEFPRDQTTISSPVTIVDGKGGGRCDGGITIDLAQYTDYAISKYERMQQEEQSNGRVATRLPISWQALSANNNSPLKAIGTVLVDTMAYIIGGILCNVPAAGTGTVTLTVTYFDVIAGATPLTSDIILTSAAEGTPFAEAIFLLAGSTITVSVSNSGAYSTATYDAFVKLF